ncbi:MAG: transporter substrate-binding domain-containing protein [Acidobacteriota bacterium]
MGTIRRVWLVAALCSWAAVSLCTTPSFAETSRDDLATVKERGTLIVLGWPHQESAFIRRMVAELGDEGLDRFTGLDVEIMRAWAEDLDIELEIRPLRTSFGDLLPALLRGEGDVAMSSLSVTPAREEIVDFSRPYHEVKRMIITRRDETASTIDDLRGRAMAAVPGSSQEEALRKLGFDTVVASDFTLDSYIAVAEGRADGTLVDSNSAADVLARYPDLERRLEVAIVLPEGDQYAVALRPGSTLKASLDSFLERLAASGELDALKKIHLQPSD